MSVVFDGTGDLLTVASSPVSGPGFTMGCWYQATSAAVDDAIMSINDTTANNRYLLLSRGTQAGDPIAIQATAGGTTTTTNTSTGFTTNTWYNPGSQIIAAASRRVTIDGGSAGTSAVSRNATGLAEVTLGAGLAGGGNELSGRIAGAYIYNGDVGDGNVSILALGAHPLTVQPNLLLAYWPLGSVTEVRDWVGGRNLTVTGNPTVGDHPPILKYPNWPIG